MKQLFSTNGILSGTKTLLTVFALIVLAKFAVAATPDMVTAVGSSGALLLTTLGTLYFGRQWTERNKNRD